jgi:hypothetical protein
MFLIPRKELQCRLMAAVALTLAMTQQAGAE